MTTPQTFDPYAGEIVPVPVHVLSAGPGVLSPPAPVSVRPRKAATLRTVFLSNVNPVQALLGHSPNRCEAYVVQYGDADFVVCHSEADAVSVSQEATYGQGTAGALVPKLLAAPLPICTTDDVWVSGNSTDLSGVKVIRVGVVEIMYASD